jgi:hypothetical protein
MYHMADLGLRKRLRLDPCRDVDLGGKNGRMREG